MKKLFLVALVLALAGLANFAIAASDTQSVTVSATVGSTFDLTLYPRPLIDDEDENIAFPGGAITFPAITGTESIVYPTGRAAFDGISDIGLLCLSNQANNVPANNWGVSMSISGNIPYDNLVVYIPSNAYNRNSQVSDPIGGIQRAARWYKFESSPIVLYRADVNHYLTTPNGTLITLSFAIIPSGKFTDENNNVICTGSPLPAGSYNASILFTMANGI